MAKNSLCDSQLQVLYTQAQVAYILLNFVTESSPHTQAKHKHFFQWISEALTSRCLL
jgi:hypothetical protein